VEVAEDISMRKEAAAAEEAAALQWRPRTVMVTDVVAAVAREAWPHRITLRATGFSL
jgi:hypothetical protein